MVSHALTGLRAGYLVGEVVSLHDLPVATSRVIAASAWGEVYEAVMSPHGAQFGDLNEGTHTFAALDANGVALAEDYATVRRVAGEDPVMGFVTSFGADSRDEVLTWLRDLRCTVVQVYDWMDSYSVPLATTRTYDDPLGRPINLDDLRALIVGIKGQGAIAQAYAPVCAADADIADANPQWRLFRNDGQPQSLGDLLQVMNPGAAGWQNYWIEQYSRALDVLGFDGLHLDTYGYPRAALDDHGDAVEMDDGYASFIAAVRSARPHEVISFNQVNGVPRDLIPPSDPSFRYVEIWPPNTLWRHLEALLQRSAGAAPFHGDTIAIYPPVWHLEGDAALYTVLTSHAVLTMLGANALVWGDRRGVLCHPYYVNHHNLNAADAERVLEWHRFGLRCRDLFKAGVDTSWYELSDENAAVIVNGRGQVSPEPVGGALFTRVRRDHHRVAVSVLDLRGSADGSWSSGTEPGEGDELEVIVVVERPERWHAEVAVLGKEGGRFVPVPTESREMREGNGLVCRVPLVTGWSVVRFVEGEES
jgi:dextranase